MGFHEEHGRIGDFEGKFDDQITAAAHELLSRIAGVLIRAALVEEMSSGVFLATLRKVKRKPSLLDRVPESVRFAIAGRYRREDEAAAKYWADVYGEAPENYPADVRSPTADNVQRATQLVIDYGANLERTAASPCAGLSCRAVGSFVSKLPRNREKEIDQEAEGRRYTPIRGWRVSQNSLKPSCLRSMPFRRSRWSSVHGRQYRSKGSTPT